MITSARGRVLLGLTIAIASLAALLWVLQRRWRYDESKVNAIGNSNRPGISVAGKSSPVPIAPAPETPWPSTSPAQIGSNIDPTLLPESGQTPGPSSIPDSFIGKLKLIIPVAGVQPITTCIFRFQSLPTLTVTGKVPTSTHTPCCADKPNVILPGKESSDGST